MVNYKIRKFPKTRLATIDICALGLKKHHITSLIEVDVTESREKIKKYKREINKISFTAWLIKAISLTINDHPLVAAYLKGKGKIVVFNDINISLLIEKDVDSQKVPIPLIIKKANESSIETITEQINAARNEKLNGNEIVIQRKATSFEHLYYILPGFIRRLIWKYILKLPQFAYNKMGNVAITSVGITGNGSGWFIPISIHPICFGISSIHKKPVVIENKIVIREMLNMSVLIDHDVVDGAPMARFINDLKRNIEKGVSL